MPGPGKPFQKGETRAPGPGRPKVPDAFKEKCRKLTDTVVLEAWEQEVRTRGDHWPKAAEMIAAYGRGKPSQTLEHTGPEGGPVKFVIDLTGDE